MPAVQERIPAAALRRLQLRLRPVLRPAGRNNAAKQGACSGDAGCDSEVRKKPFTVGDRWFAERAGLGTPLSYEELDHGYRHGLLSDSGEV